MDSSDAWKQLLQKRTNVQDVKECPWNQIIQKRQKDIRTISSSDTPTSIPSTSPGPPEEKSQ